MFILLLVAFISGLLTIFAPCIWPILPIVLSSSTGGKQKPLGITLGILISFTIVTLSLSYLVKAFGFDPDSLRFFAIIIIGFLGLVLIVPRLGAILEGWASMLTGKLGSRFSSGQGFLGGIISGLALGIVWSPCAGPILATIAALSATRAVNSQVVLITLVYMIGTGLPLFVFASAGSKLLTKSRSLSPYTGIIQRILGIIMIVTAALIWTGYDRVLQAKLLDLFPSYSNVLYKLEQSNQVQEQLNRISGQTPVESQGPKSFLPDMGRAPDFIGINNWLNSPPLSLDSLKGKVVLVDFWTYSCINCIRTFPFVSGWYEKYKNDGFVVVGVHTPEFEFEKKTENVENAIKMFNIKYPVAQDNSYSTWNNYKNRYWPAKYLIDKEGRLRYKHFGEGEYDVTEKAIQSLLAETGKAVPTDILNMPDLSPRTRMTPETYLGKSRAERFSSIVTLTGNWKTQNEYIESSIGSVLKLDFTANKVFLVITPRTTSDVVTVMLDGKVVDDSSAGKDVLNGKIIFDTARLYELIDLKGSSGQHILELNFGSAGTQAFAFTFG